MLGLAITLLPLAVKAAGFWGDGGGTESIGDVASNITRSLVGVSGLLTAICYIIGMGFALSGLMKFKAHKDSPQQMPLSQPITELAIGASLIFLPMLAHLAGSTAFDKSAEHVRPEGTVERDRPVHVERVQRPQPVKPIVDPNNQQKKPTNPYHNR